jgi:hypothetical protein
MGREDDLPYFLIVVICFCLAGCCGDYQLIAFRKPLDEFSGDLNWKKERELRSPQNELEESVVQVATNHQVQGNGKTMIVYVTHEGNDSLIAAVENISESTYRYEPKRVVRYIVQSGRIRATMGPSIEPFPDVSFERSVLFATHKAIAEGGWSVVPILNWIEPVTLKGIVLGRCHVELRIFRTDYGGPGDLICTKSINPCPPE